MSERNAAAGRNRRINNRRDYRFSQQRTEALSPLPPRRVTPRRFYVYHCIVPKHQIYVVTDEEGNLTSLSAPVIRHAGLVGHSLDALRMHLIITGMAPTERDISIELIHD